MGITLYIDYGRSSFTMDIRYLSTWRISRSPIGLDARAEVERGLQAHQGMGRLPRDRPSAAASSPWPKRSGVASASRRRIVFTILTLAHAQAHAGFKPPACYFAARYTAPYI